MDEQRFDSAYCYIRRRWRTQIRFNRRRSQLASHILSTRHVRLFLHLSSGDEGHCHREIGRNNQLEPRDQPLSRAMMDYFKPLMSWLEEQSNGRQIGW